MNCIFSCLAALTAVSISANAALVGYWTFDNPGNPFNDDSGSGNHLTSVGADPTHQAGGGFNGGGFNFANTVGDQRGDQRLVAPIDINPGVMPQATLGGWVRTDTIAPDLYKFMGHDNGAWDRTVGLDTREGGFRYTAFTGTNNNGPVDLTLGPVNTTDWTFFAAVYDNLANTVTVYIDLNASTNDVLFSISEPTAMGPGLGTVSIGSLRPDNNAEGWVGNLDQMFILDHAATAGELTQYRNQGFVIPEPSTTLYSALVAGLMFLRRRRKA